MDWFGPGGMEFVVAVSEILYIQREGWAFLLVLLQFSSCFHVGGREGERGFHDHDFQI